VSVIAASRAPETVVCAWVDAFNARDLGGMLACLDHEVRFHPLRLLGLDGSYHGHDGVRRWFDRLAQLRCELLIDVSEVRPVGDGQVFATGTVRLCEDALAPFSAVHRIAGKLITATHHYLSDPSLLEHLGLVR
jgi:hypothetical protein